MTHTRRGIRGKKTIFRALFAPLFLIMVLQSAIFYLIAMYGGIEESLSQNATQILSERLVNQKNELEARFLNRSFGLDACSDWLEGEYAQLEKEYGDKPLVANPARQIQFLSSCADVLIDTLRQNETNGVFLILNDLPDMREFSGDSERRYGLLIRDIDQESNYFGREDLLIERSPSSIVDSLGCLLDSWWEAFFTFTSPEHGDYYYYPLDAAWRNPGADGVDLAYFAGTHKVSGSDQAVVSFSVPLMGEDGYPFGVVGVELTTKYLASLLPNHGLYDLSMPCYVLALRQEGSDLRAPIVGSGALYTRSFGIDEPISSANKSPKGGFTVTGRGGTELHGFESQIVVYNNNNPFEHTELVLMALADSDALFAHIGRVKVTLFLASVFCLGLGLAAILWVSRRFAAPVKQLAERVRNLSPQPIFKLGRLGITEIDQLVESIETLNRDVSRNSARTEFFSRMSHDMRTPMNAIISFSSPELTQGADESTKDDFLEKINASGKYLLGLINEVLDMTKIESDKVELRMESVQVIRLFDTTIPIIEELTQNKRLRFESDISVDPDMYVLADALHINQIVMNLLSNAVKFTPEGGRVRFAMRSTEFGEDSVNLSISVSDTGIGMSETFMKSLFKPFEREHNTSEGTGLGLAIAKKLIDLMHGTIHCVSKQGEGTEFSVELPLRKHAPDKAEERLYAAERVDMNKLRGKRVLLCEDNALNTQIASHLLAKAGVHMDAAENGEVGVSMFTASEPFAYDAILMDVRMPVMDGLTAARRIRETARPDSQSVPIIAMTANAFDEDVKQTKDAGMNEHLAKPIETAKFFEVLWRYMCRE